MTAASELKSAAVVQKQSTQDESRKRKTPGQKASNTNDEVTDIRNEANRQASKASQNVEAVSAANGSTTAGATQTVAAAYEASGSSAATASKAASIQATRLPVSVFPQNSRNFPGIQNRVALRHTVSERWPRMGCAA
jgi:hypothetical protein